MVACDFGPKGDPKDPSATKDPSKNEEEIKDKPIIGEVTISKDGKEQYTLVIHSIILSEERNPYWSTEPEQVIIIDYSYENLGSEEGIYIDFECLEVVDSAGNISFIYPAADFEKQPERIGIGEKCNAEEAYGLEVGGGTIKINFYEDIILSLEPDWIFEFEIKS